eukprot:3939796-Rhodomonas_salina.1
MYPVQHDEGPVLQSPDKVVSHCAPLGYRGASNTLRPTMMHIGSYPGSFLGVLTYSWGSNCNSSTVIMMILNQPMVLLISDKPFCKKKIGRLTVVSFFLDEVSNSAA